MSRCFSMVPVAGIVCTVLSGSVLAHGYVSLSESGIVSRVALCNSSASEGMNKNEGCGSIEWEPQSVEGPDGFPEKGPADGKIASAGTSLAANLDEQTSERWNRVGIQSGANTFEWTLTAPHKTADWKYYITKQGWDENSPLTRASFELTPFCEYSGNMEAPPSQVFHDCSVPERDGYHVILAVWDVGDTAAAFYNVIDVDFSDDDGSTDPVSWEKVGQITPTMDLKIGDAVYTRVFDQFGENHAYSTRLEITNEQMRKAKNWSYALADEVNKTNDNIKAGKVSDGKFSPIYGTNPVYVSEHSGFTSVEIGYDILAEEDSLSVNVGNLEPEYVISQGESLTIDLELMSKGDVSSEITIYNDKQESLARWEGELLDGQSKDISLLLSKTDEGRHKLVSRVRDSEGHLVDQETILFDLIEDAPPPSGDHDYVYPEGFGSYVDGDIVLFEGEGTYQCFGPWAAHCNSESYLPGIALDPNWVSQQWKKLD